MRTLALLAVMVLTAPQILPNVEQPRDTRDAINEMGEDDMRFMQEAMDRKNELESMISESMRESDDSQNTIAPAQKD